MPFTPTNPESGTVSVPATRVFKEIKTLQLDIRLPLQGQPAAFIAIAEGETVNEEFQTYRTREFTIVGQVVTDAMFAQQPLEGSPPDPLPLSQVNQYLPTRYRAGQGGVYEVLRAIQAIPQDGVITQ